MNVPGWLMTFAVLMSLSIGRALAGETATAVATITAGFVTGITVTSGARASRPSRSPVAVAVGLQPRLS